MKRLTDAHQSPIATLIALIGVLTVPNAHSLTLGELELQSYVGQPFRAVVPYKTHSGEVLSSDCLRLLQPNNDLPALGSANINVISRSDNSGQVHISTNQAIGEPTVGFGIQVECNGLQLSRSFTAFLNVAPVNEPLPLPSLARPAKVSPQQASVANLPSRDPETLTVRKNTTLRELGKRYYPEGTPQYPRYLNKLISVNPGYTEDTPIATGTTIIIPERLRSTKKTTPKPPRPDSGLLRLDGESLERPTKVAASTPAEYTRELERKLLELNELQSKMQLEIAQLNQRLAQMNQLDASAVAVASMASAVSAQALSPAATTQASTANPASTTAPALAPVASPETDNDQLGWWAGLAAAIAALGAAAWFVIRRRNQSEQDNSLYTEHNLSQFAPNPTHRAPGGFLTQNTVMSMLHVAGTPQGIEVQEDGLTDEMARAQFLIAQGETMDAIDILYRCIDEQPEDIERWLMLFRLFRQQGMKTEYAHLAQNLKVIQHDEADWELVRNIGAKLDPENPLYFREKLPEPVSIGQHTADYAHAFGLDQPQPIAQELELDLDAPNSPDLSMMASMKSATPAPAVPAQYESLLLKADQTPPADHSIDLPDLDDGGTLPDLSKLDEVTPSFEVEELNLNAIDEKLDDNTLEFDLEPLPPPSAPDKDKAD
jgi:pilus assembly protein FimV